MRVDALVHDFVISLRMLRRAPAFTLTVVATIALGIGATSLVLAVFDTVVWQALPFPEPDRLVAISSTLRDTPSRHMLLTLGDIAALRGSGRSFAGLATYRAADSLNLTGAGDTERLPVAQVSIDFFSTLGASPLIGRTFGPRDADPARDHVVILSHTAWQQHFAAAPDTIGRTITLGNAPYLVIGIMPSAFQFPGEFTGIWLPQPMTADAIDHSARDHAVIARLRPGIAIETANAELQRLATALVQQGTEWVPEFTLAAMPLRDRVLGSATTVLRMLMVTVVFVLLTACANVAGLLLLRGANRQRETAVRRALGASWLDIIRRFVAESLILSGIGYGLGVLFAVWGARVLRSSGFTAVPQLKLVEVGAPILIAALAVSLLAALVVTFLPAIRAITSDVTTSLRVGALASQTGFGLRRGIRSQHLLAFCQIAVVVILVAGFGLFARSLSALAAIDVGFEPRNLLMLLFDTRGQKITPPATSQAVDEIDALPGVRTAAWTNLPPHLGLNVATTLLVGRASGLWAPGGTVASREVTERYFDTMQMPLLRGRPFAPTDGATTPCVAIINESLAGAGWPQENPVGRRINLNADRTGTKATGRPRLCEVIGVARNARDVRLDKAPEPQVYFAVAQQRRDVQTLLVRTQDQGAASAAAIVQRLRTVGITQPVWLVRPMSDLVDAAIIVPRFYTVLLGTFAGLAMMLAAVGVYGISAHAASRRTREIGIRLVLGARPGQVIGLVARSGAFVSGMGIVTGTLAAVGLSRFVTSLLFEVQPLDSLTFVVTPLIVAMVAIVAVYLPARRAARMELGEVLRVE